jgi:hypothetical protein
LVTHIGIVAAIVALGSTSVFVEAKRCAKGAVVGGLMQVEGL